MPTSTNNETKPELDALAKQIDASHKKARKAEWSGLPDVRKTGQLLQKVKAQLKHGKWEPWVEKNCAFTIREAQRYMFVAKHYKAIQASKTKKKKLSLRECIASLAEKKGKGKKVTEPVTFTAEELKAAESAERKPKFKADSTVPELIDSEADRIIRKLLQMASRSPFEESDGSGVELALAFIALRNYLVEKMNPQHVVSVAEAMTGTSPANGQKPVKAKKPKEQQAA